MKFKIPYELVTEHPRGKLEKHLLGLLKEITISNTDITTMTYDDQSIVYTTARNNARVTVTVLLLHMLVDPVEYPKPWLFRTRIKAPLELVQFKEYITEVRNKLAKQAPTSFYGSLVYIQAIQSFLSTMEITNDAT